MVARQSKDERHARPDVRALLIILTIAGLATLIASGIRAVRAEEAADRHGVLDVARAGPSHAGSVGSFVP